MLKSMKPNFGKLCLSAMIGIAFWIFTEMAPTGWLEDIQFLDTNVVMELYSTVMVGCVIIYSFYVTSKMKFMETIPTYILCWIIIKTNINSVLDIEKTLFPKAMNFLLWLLCLYILVDFLREILNIVKK